MKHKIAEWVFLIVRLTLGVIFIVSSIPKLRQPYDFLASVYGYKLVSPQIGLVVAMILPWLELFVGICLVGGIFVSGAILASIVMCAMFSFVLISALWRGLSISCGCFNPSGAGIICYWTVSRALLLLLASLTAYTYITFFCAEKMTIGSG
jgi:uncharacterized membrane protein YphA (DoxX/SURF4 family)